MSAAGQRCRLGDVICSALSIALSVALYASIPTVHAQASTQTEAVQRYDIPAGPLSKALSAWGAQSGKQLVFLPDLVAGKTSKGVSGRYTSGEALTQLLSGSGVTWEVMGGSTIVLKKAPDLPKAPASKPEQRTETTEATETIATASSKTSDAVTELDGIMVTGTRLRDTPPTSPLISFDREDLDRGGYATTQEVFSKLPQNFSGISTSTGAQTGYYTTSQIDLRGLGSESTLTLVNGRRVSRAAGHEGRAVDIGMIPISAIERIDILTDGASALYGSDAVAGVVNIVLREDFEGGQTTFQYGAGDASVDHRLIGQTFGAHWNGGRMLVSAQYDRRDAQHVGELGITTMDLRSQGGGDYRFQGFGSPGTVYSAGFFAGLPFSTITTPGGGPVLSVALPDGDGRNLAPADFRLNQQSVLDGVGQLIPRHLAPEQESTSFYLNLEQTLGAVTLFADAVASRRDSRMSFIPPLGYLMVPTTNAFSPFAEPVLVGYQLTEFDHPSRWRNTGWFTNLGARGRFGWRDWTWEVVGNFSEDASKGRSIGYDTAELNARLASPDPGYAFNPFGNGSGQSPGVVEALLRHRFAEGRTSAHAFSTLAQGSLAELAGGQLRAALGAEYREESLEAFRGGAGTPTQTQFELGLQKATAVFGEAYIPVFGKANARPGLLEFALSAAARYERYDGFGDTFNPKIGALWRPTASLLLKTNWGTSFRAPSLRELYYPASTNNTARVFDPRAPGGPREVFYQLNLGGNRDLEPETADTFSLAAEYRPASLEGARISVSYYRIDYEKRITGAGDGLTQALLFEYEDSLPAGIIVRDAAGNLVSLSTAYVNSARTRISGWDLDAGYAWHGGWGYFDLSASATVSDVFDNQIVPGAPMQAQAGVVGSVPKWRGRLGLSWSHADWGANISVHRIDAMEVTDPDPRIVRRQVDGQTTTDLQLSYVPHEAAWPWLRGVSVRIGVNNLFDQPSPFVDGPFTYGIGQQNFLIDGRTAYLRVTKTFGAAAQ